MNYFCSFARNQWNQNDFQTVTSPRWGAVHSEWEQLSDSLVNKLAPDWTTADKSREGEAYISMLHRNPICGEAKIETTCLFKERMAPAITLSKELTPVHKEHLEIVLFDQGINLWHHHFDDNKASWNLVACWEYDFNPDEKYRLITEIRFGKRGHFICMGINEITFSCLLPENWPQTYYAGLTASEGRVHFYDFSISELDDNQIRHKRYN